MPSLTPRARLKLLRAQLRYAQMNARLAARDLHGWREKARTLGAAMRAVTTQINASAGGIAGKRARRSP